VFDLTGNITDYRTPSPVRSSPANIQWRIKKALGIYAGFGPTAGTIARTYWHVARRIPCDMPSGFRFGYCSHCNGGIHPVMAAPVVDIDGVQTGVHLTYLADDGLGKAFTEKDLQRRTRGVISGGTVRLADHDPQRELAIGEGIETSAAASVLLNLPAWSAVSAGGLRTVTLPPTMTNIVIVADHDITGVGQRNALDAYQRWTAEGRSVRIVMPPNPGDDFNDILMRRGA
jgi:putative DNA primase/helicase